MTDSWDERVSLKNELIGKQVVRSLGRIETVLEHAPIDLGLHNTTISMNPIPQHALW